jgi:hypothetical protein
MPPALPRGRVSHYALHARKEGPEKGSEEPEPDDMISFNGYLHREELAAIIGRWLLHRQQPDDGRRLKAIINFNAYLGRLYLDDFARQLLTDLHGPPIDSFPVRTKGQLKDFITLSPVRRNPRIDEMLFRYERYPEDFYRETPFDGRLYHRPGDDGHLGSTRIKRFRRIAEKASRRIIDYIFEEVKANADALAAERAARLGIPKQYLITPVEEQVAEFAHAERRVLKAIRNATLSPSLPALPINDVLGVKTVAEGERFERLLDLLAKGPRTAIIEREVHSGHYNATNLIVKYRWPREAYAERPPEGRTREVLVKRGILEEEIDPGYREFIRTAEDEVHIEVIVASYEEMLESEIGRSMHEERVLAQRANQQYHGSMAKNIEYLMEFMLLFCLSPKEDPGEVPVRLWIKYMPDYMDHVVRQLFGLSPEGELTGLF